MHFEQSARDKYQLFFRLVRHFDAHYARFDARQQRRVTGQRAQLTRFARKNHHLLDDGGVIDTSDDLHRALVVRAESDVDIEHRFQTLGPRHGGAGGSRRWDVGGIGARGVATLRFRDGGTLVMVRVFPKLKGGKGRG